MDFDGHVVNRIGGVLGGLFSVLESLDGNDDASFDLSNTGGDILGSLRHNCLLVLHFSQDFTGLCSCCA